MEREKLRAAEHSLVSLYGHVLLVWLQLSLVPLWFVTRENYNIDLICSEASREGERERCLLHTAARYGQVSIGSLINGSSADMIMTRVTKCQSDHWLRDCPQDDDLVTCGLSAIYPLGQCWTINVNYWINIPVFSPVRQNNEHKWERVNLWPLEMSFHSVQFWRYPIMARPHIMLRLGNIL